MHDPTQEAAPGPAATPSIPEPPAATTQGTDPLMLAEAARSDVAQQSRSLAHVRAVAYASGALALVAVVVASRRSAVSA